MVDKQLISEIKNSVNIVDVIGEVLFMVKRRLLLMSSKINSSIIVLVVANQAMFLSLSKTIGVSPSWKLFKLLEIR